MKDIERKKKELLAPLLFEAGAALLDCQGFEYSMGLLLFHFSRLGAEGLNPNRLFAIMEDRDKKTAGQLLSMIRKHCGPSTEIITALEEGLHARNHLVHRILIYNIERFADQKQRQEVIAAIRDLRSKIQKAAMTINPFVKTLSLAFYPKVGEQAEEAFSRFLAQHSETSGAEG